jgi:hypothetical protein
VGCLPLPLSLSALRVSKSRQSTRSALGSWTSTENSAPTDSIRIPSEWNGIGIFLKYPLHKKRKALYYFDRVLFRIEKNILCSIRTMQCKLLSVNFACPLLEVFMLVL